LGTVLPFGITWEAPEVKEKPTVPDWVMMGGGVACLLFSFFAFWDFGPVSKNAYGSFAFPLATYVVLIGIIVGGSVALKVFVGTKLPEPILTFTWKQIRLALSIFAGLLMIGFLLLSDSPDKGIGFWLMFLGTIALVAGAVMETIGFDPQAAKPGAAPGATPPAPPPAPGTPPPPPPPSA
jgi:hypothetical protein